MNELTEVTVILKDDEKTMRHKFLCYEEMHNMPVIREYIEEAKKNFTGDPESVIIKTTMVIQ